MRCHSRRGKWSRVHLSGPQRPYEDWATVGGEAGHGGPRWRERSQLRLTWGGAISEIYELKYCNRYRMRTLSLVGCVVYVLHQNEGGIGKSIPDAERFPGTQEI